ncbi:MAG: FAD:protein FMN transferase [Phycisphaerae bacterium]|nr:FAD:protein FMN transferase [Phycisphaerae bacterium]
MGVRAQIVLFAPDETRAVAAAQAAFQRLEDLDQTLSDYRPSSELMRLCDSPPGTPIPISPDLAEVLETAVQIARCTDGAYDPTVGPLVALWRRSRSSLALPSEAERAEARLFVGWHKLVLNGQARSATLSRSGMRLDLGGIGKGFAAHKAQTFLRELGYPMSLVALAGDIRAGDPPPERGGWRVAIPEPEGDSARDGGISLLLSNQSISTSGASAQHVDIGGVRYAHVVDSRTGLGATRLNQATVVSFDGAIADALSTASAILDPGRALAICGMFPGTQTFIVESGERPIRHSSPGWALLLAPKNDTNPDPP